MDKLGPFSETNIYVSWSTSELRVRLAHCETDLSPPVKYFYWLFQGGTSFVDHLCYLCLVFVMLLSLFIAALWSPEGKGWPLGSCLWCLLCFCYFPIWYPGTGVVLDCIDSWSLLSFLLSICELFLFCFQIDEVIHQLYDIMICSDEWWVFNKSG